MKRVILTFLLCCLSVALKAQEADLKPPTSFATWTDIIFRKDIGKWHVGGLIEYCTIDKFNGKGLVSDEIIIRPIVGYDPLNWLRFQFQVDFLYSYFSGFYLRYLPDISFHWKAADFRFSIRNRLQLSHHVSTGVLKPVIRSRFKVDYLIPKSPVSLHVAAEPYWLKSISKARYYAGVDVQVHEYVTLSADYIRYDNYAATSAHSNVLYLALYVRLKDK